MNFLSETVLGTLGTCKNEILQVARTVLDKLWNTMVCNSIICTVADPKMSCVTHFLVCNSSNDINHYGLQQYHFHMWHSSFIRATWLNDTCDMTHWYAWPDSLIYVTWLIHRCNIWLIHMCDMTNSYVWRDLCLCVTWLIHMCDLPDTHVQLIHIRDMTRPHLWRDAFIHVTRLIHWRINGGIQLDEDAKLSFTCVTWLIHICNMTPSHVWRDSFTYA